MERPRDRYRRPPKKPNYQRRGPRKKKQFIKKFREVIILDLLLHGHPEEDKPSWSKTPIAQVITMPDFVLYEVKVNKDADIKVQEKNTYEEFTNQNKCATTVEPSTSNHHHRIAPSPYNAPPGVP
jgi:predicted nucleic acid-binding OB-fold protein